MIEYIDDKTAIGSITLQGFFEGWRKPLTPKEHRELLIGSSHFIVAVDTELNQAVGFITAVTDGVLSAFIPLLEVLPDFKNQGIGKQLIVKMLKKLDDINNIDLICDDEMRAYYHRLDLGFFDIPGMAIRKYR